MSLIILPGDPPLDIILRRSARARRLSLRVSGIDGRITLTMPRVASQRAAHAFARARESWLRARLAETPRVWRPHLGARLPLAGRDVPILPTKGETAQITADAVYVPADAPDVAAVLRAGLIDTARKRATRSADVHAAALERRYGTLRLRDPRSRWGSCSPTGDLMVSWRLVMAPPAVLDYLVAHEVAHLVARDHSPAFWRLVAWLCPDHNTQRRWLREHGPALQRIRFAPVSRRS